MNDLEGSSKRLVDYFDEHDIKVARMEAERIERNIRGFCDQSSRPTEGSVPENSHQLSAGGDEEDPEIVGVTDDDCKIDKEVEDAMEVVRGIERDREAGLEKDEDHRARVK